jgi:ribokinase
MPKPIVVVGSINLDLVSTGKRIPGPGETLVGDKFQTFHGGKGANQAVAIGRLGYPVSMIAKVGDDEFGAGLRKGLAAEKVNVKAVETAKGFASGVALISVDAKGQNSITVVPGANGQLVSRDLEKSLPLLRSAGIILTQLETTLEAVDYLCDVARRYNVPLMLDPAPAHALPRKTLRCVTYLTPNETETCTMCGIPAADLIPSTVAEIAATLAKTGAANIIVKMGSHGAYIHGADGLRKWVSAFKVKAVDTTAAGDAFNGAFAVALMQGLDLEEAVRFASAAGALSATRAGAQPSMPTAQEVAALLNGKGAARGSKPARVNGTQR